MLVMKSYFLNEWERYKMEEIILCENKEMTEADVLLLDDRELMVLINNLTKE
ncbi:hypothetical protein [Bacillus sp. B15-48]|uniref:hypothetical protein n=1 Tax=Bacillus sp. B15-48 TaxID=1548601 RepID=UPI00193F7906|nr:hypothetical protein [Bacillus sp. B15-48]